MEKRCTDCGKNFDPQREGIVGKVDGKPMNFCGPCCRKEVEQ